MDLQVAVPSSIPNFLPFSLETFSLDPLSTFTFLLSYHHSSPIHIAVILPPPNHHLVLDVIEAVRINGNIKILWYLLLVRELVKSGEAG